MGINDVEEHSYHLPPLLVRTTYQSGTTTTRSPAAFIPPHELFLIFRPLNLH